MNALAKHDKLLQQHHFVLVRQDKHRVYRNPEGRVYVTASTPSDWRAGFNMLTSLERCLRQPPKPMVIAISDFEREQAALLIQGQQKLQHTAPGMGGGKQHRSRGTGYRYTDPKVLTMEELAQKEQLRQQAIANIQRREEREQQRRAAKLARRQAVQQQKQIQEQQFEETFRPFLKNVIQDIVSRAESDFTKFCHAEIANRAWTEQFFYEFPVAPDDQKAETDAHKHLVRTYHSKSEECHNPAEYRGPLTGIDALDQVVEENKQLAQQSLDPERRTQRVDNALRFVEKQLRQSASVFDLLDAVETKRDRIYDHVSDQTWVSTKGRCLQCRSEATTGFADFGALYEYTRLKLIAWLDRYWPDTEIFDALIHKDELVFLLKDDTENTVKFLEPEQEPVISIAA